MTVLGKNINIAVVVILSMLAITLTGCDGGGGGGGGTDTNPVANAGPDKNVATGSRVTLDGSKSSNASTYSWSLTPPAGSTATLSSATVSRPTFTADTAGTYTLSLVVGNGSVNSSPDTVTITAVNPRAVPDTGQIASYTTTTGEDHDYLISAPSYTDHGDGTITDNVTGLMWQKCSLGQITTSCTGTINTYNWYEASGTANTTYNPGGAVNACAASTLAGQTDWRLPTTVELLSIADYSGNFTEAINTTYFAPSPIFASHWSSTAVDGLTNYAWYFSFLTGSMAHGVVTTENYVRCVRGGSSAAILTDNGDGTVTDEVTGLTWQKQADGTKRTWEDALTYCEGLSLGGSGNWRLPNVKELDSILDYTAHGPAINTDYFLGTPSSTDTYYWSSTTDVLSSAYAWSVNFYQGAIVFTTLKTGSNYTRCVR